MEKDGHFFQNHRLHYQNSDNQEVIVLVEIELPRSHLWCSTAIPSSLSYCAGLHKAYIAVTGTHTFFYSEDGISWTSNSSDELAGTFVCSAPELEIYCAVGSSPPYSSIFDGENWTASSLSSSLSSVCWIPDLKIFVAVGLNSIFTFLLMD